MGAGTGRVVDLFQELAQFGGTGAPVFVALFSEESALDGLPSLQEFLRQRKGESTAPAQSFAVLEAILADVAATDTPPPPEPEPRKASAPRGKRG